MCTVAPKCGVWERQHDPFKTVSVRESEGVRDRCFSGRREVTKESKKPEAEEQRRDDDLQKLSVSAECSS